ncbi:hypothetical protein BRADI_1g60556v3 [Brachypodium distachyon]|uniref:Uncharacterized protein n=1 Tax=Brachypodium distachyon TaxID=15368 RepID=A0A0Q3JVC2_BRADI|nr:hypothetical protein BRADI_1g60556v3 [Brachypodium distachyon]
MIFPKLSKAALLLALLILSCSHIMCSQGTSTLMTTMHGRNLLRHSEEASKAMIRATLSADGYNGKGGGSGIGNVEDSRPTGPGHSPGAGHADTSNGVGRKLLGLNQ